MLWAAPLPPSLESALRRHLPRCLLMDSSSGDLETAIAARVARLLRLWCSQAPLALDVFTAADFSVSGSFEDLVQYEAAVLVVANEKGHEKGHEKGPESSPSSSERLIAFLEELISDHRVERDYFSGLKLAVVGVDNDRSKPTFCLMAKIVQIKMARLGAKILAPAFLYDSLEFGEADDSLDRWVLGTLAALLAKRPQRRTSLNANDVLAEELQSTTSSDVSSSDSYSNCDQDQDLEDSAAGCCGPAAGEEAEAEKQEVRGRPKKRPMLKERMRAVLEKQGYRLVGSHSAVKLCRWTKSQLRARGGCYKRTFYGIESHQCMEATPSLACANKCVFCWRHHSNPVGTEWKWQQDHFKDVVDGMISNHLAMIKQLKGAQAVAEDRFQAASTTIRHCALSLVGEPIMYPQFPAFLQYLHERSISTFVVTNGQFPDQMAELPPVTQLYVSVDAGNREALRAVDRPLFEDFWERLMDCLDQLARIPQRTVFRLTLVKDRNMDSAKEFASLIRRGRPDFVEIKAATFAGHKRRDLTMQDIPWHEELVEFARQILEDLSSDELSSEYDSYALACEHRHSTCVLLAQKRYYREGRWWTWIDYRRFFELVAKGGREFSGLEYAAPTPSWAVYGAAERGFAPEDTRVMGKGKNKRLFLAAAVD